MHSYEHDRLQCSAVTQDKKRCMRIGTHGNGGEVLCEAHHQLMLKKKEAGKNANTKINPSR